MKTIVSTCGNYNCAHCAPAGTCMLCVISITPEGRCGLYKPSKGKIMSVHSEQDEHTNMC